MICRPGREAPDATGALSLACQPYPMSIQFRSDTPERCAYLFPGQGSQYVGMGQALCHSSPVARDTLEEAEAVLGLPLRRLCFEGPEAELTDTVNTQPALLAVSIAAWRAAAQALGALPAPVVFAGHSMGEYSALVAAEALPFADGLRLVRERGRLMKAMGESRPGRMAAVVGMEAEALHQLCRDIGRRTGHAVQIANDNCPLQQVVSGTLEGVEEVLRTAPGHGARRVVPLAVSIAAHSPLMTPARERWADAVAEMPIQAPRAPLIGNTTAQALTSPAAIEAELVAQLDGGVQWHASMLVLRRMGVTTCAEMGSGTVLKGLLRRIDRRMACFALQEMKDIAEWEAWWQALGLPARER